MKPRTAAQQVAAKLEEYLEKDLGHRIRYDQALRLASRACRELGGIKPTGTTHNALATLEYSGYFIACIPTGRERPTEYVIRGRHPHLEHVTTSELLAELTRRNTDG